MSILEVQEIQRNEHAESRMLFSPRLYFLAALAALLF